MHGISFLNKKILLNLLDISNAFQNNI